MFSTFLYILTIFYQQFVFINNPNKILLGLHKFG